MLALRASTIPFRAVPETRNQRAAPDPQAPPPCAPPRPLPAGRGVLLGRPDHGDREPAAEPRTEARAGRPGRRLRLRGQRQGDPRGPPRLRGARARRLERHLTVDEACDRRHRGPPLLRAPRGRPARDPACGMGGCEPQEHRAGRLHDHAAVREELAYEQRPLDRTEVEGGGARMAARVRPATLVEDADPDRVPEHDLPRQRSVRRRDSVKGVLRAQRQDADASGGRAARRDSRGSFALGPGDTPECSARTAAHGAAGHAAARAHLAGRLRPREQSAAAEAAGRARARRAGPEGALLHELRQAAARGPLRIVCGVWRRPARADLDQPSRATGGARRDREVAELDRRAERRSRRD